MRFTLPSLTGTLKKTIIIIITTLHFSSLGTKPRVQEVHSCLLSRMCAPLFNGPINNFHGQEMQTCVCESFCSRWRKTPVVLFFPLVHVSCVYLFFFLVTNKVLLFFNIIQCDTNCPCTGSKVLCFFSLFLQLCFSSIYFLCSSTAAATLMMTICLGVQLMRNLLILALLCIVVIIGEIKLCSVFNIWLYCVWGFFHLIFHPFFLDYSANSLVWYIYLCLRLRNSQRFKLIQESGLCLFAQASICLCKQRFDEFTGLH